MDRGNLATAAPLIKGELNLSNAQYGLLVSAFFWVYVPGQIMAAWLVQRINEYRTLALGLAVWLVAGNTMNWPVNRGSAKTKLRRVFGHPPSNG